MIGVFTVLHVAGVAVLNPQNLWGTRGIRWAAGATFSIYVTHYPALHLLDATLPDMVGRDALLLLGSLLIGIGFAHYFERPVREFRNWVGRAWRALRMRRLGDVKACEVVGRGNPHLDKG